MFLYTDSLPSSVLVSTATRVEVAPLVSHIFCPVIEYDPSSALRGLGATPRRRREPRPGSDMRERAAHLAGRHPREVLLLLLRRAVLQEHVGHDEVGVDHPRHAHPPAGDLLDHQRVGQQRLAEPAELLGDRQPEHAELLQPLDDLGRVLVGVLELLGHRDDLLVHELPDSLQDLGLVLGEAIGLAEAGHVVAPGRSRLDRSESSYRSFTLGRVPAPRQSSHRRRAWPA